MGTFSGAEGLEGLLSAELELDIPRGRCNDATIGRETCQPPRRRNDNKRKKKMKEDPMSSARADIEKRVLQFREKQAKLQREREGYYDAVIEKVRATEWNEFVTPHPKRNAVGR